MKHAYELRKLEDNGSKTTVKKLFEEPKQAKQIVKEYTKRNPGLYTLYRIETVEAYFTEKKRK